MKSGLTQNIRRFIASENAIWFLLSVTFLVYIPSLFFDFVNYDDNVYITENKVIQNLSLESVRLIFTQPFNGHYFPITLLIHAFEFFLFKQSAEGFHFVSVLIHLCNVLFFYTLLKELSFSNRISFLAAVIFALHPIQVESVSWLGARNSLLASFFSFSSLIFYVEYLNSNNKPKLVFALFLFILGCLSKSSVVILPVIFFLIDYFRNRKLKLWLLLEKLPFFVISTLFGLIAIRSANKLGSIEDPSNYFSAANQFFAVFFQLSFFVYQTVFPLKLLVRYFNPEVVDGFLPLIYYLSIIIIPLIGASYYFSKNKRLNVLGWLWFVTSVFLILKVFFSTNVIGADRYLYFSIPGLIFVLLSHIKRVKSKWLEVLVLIIGGFFIFKTVDQQQVWKNSDNFYEYVINTGDGHSEAHLLYSLYQNKKKNYELSKVHAKKATLISPNNALNWNGLGISYYLANKLDSAEEAFLKAYALDSSNSKSTYYLGYIYGENGDFKKARKYLEKHLKVNPSSEKAFLAMGNIEIINKNYRLASDYYSKAIELNPESKVALYNRGHCYLLLNEGSKACKDWLKAHNLGMKKADNYIKEHCL